ncbi:MAG: hypothetical protein GY719_40735 [bacterium]|nr:hypothetical protein [bacterium]
MSRRSLEDVRIHDLGHSCANFGIKLDLRLPVIGAVLAHLADELVQWP